MSKFIDVTLLWNDEYANKFKRNKVKLNVDHITAFFYNKDGDYTMAYVLEDKCLYIDGDIVKDIMGEENDG